MGASRHDRQKSHSKNLAQILSPTRQISKENKDLTFSLDNGSMVGKNDLTATSIIKARKTRDYNNRKRSISADPHLPQSPHTGGSNHQLIQSDAPTLFFQQMRSDHPEGKNRPMLEQQDANVEQNGTGVQSVSAKTMTGLQAMFQSAKDYLSSPNPGAASQIDNIDSINNRFSDPSNRIASASHCITSPANMVQGGRNREITISQYRALEPEELIKASTNSRVKSATPKNASASRKRQMSDYKQSKDENQGKQLLVHGWFLRPYEES